MKYDDLTKRFAKWLFPLIDRLDCGYQNERGEPRPFHTDRTLQSRDLKYPPRQITRTDLWGHLHADETLFYRSWHRSGFVLAMIDIDAKRGQQDAQAVADWLRETYFPNVYCEPSRHGSGRHVYALFRVGGESPRHVNAALSRAGKALRALAIQEGFAANIDNIFGTFTLWSRDDSGKRVIERRGQMGKVPRLPSGDSSLDHLLNAPVFLPSALEHPISHAERLQKSALSSPSGTKASMSESPSEPLGGCLVCTTSGTKTSTSESSDSTTLVRLREKVAAKTNPLARMRWASSLFYHERGRYALDEEELVAFYEAHGFHTDEDRHGRRHERAKLALARHRMTERRRTLRKYRQSDFMPMIAHNVTQSVRTHPVIKYRYRVGDDLLAAALYAYTKAAFAKNRTDRMHSLSDDGLLAMFKVLSRAGVLTSKFRDKEKRVAVRQILQLAGLIVLRDGEHVYGGREYGVGDKWGLGVNHERFAEFVAAVGHVVDPLSLTPLRELRQCA